MTIGKSVLKSSSKKGNRKIPKNDLLYYDILKYLDKKELEWKGWIADAVSEQKPSLVYYRLKILEKLGLIEEEEIKMTSRHYYPYLKITEEGKSLLKKTPEDVARIIKAYRKL